MNLTKTTDLSKITNLLLGKYPEAESIIVYGSYARNDGIDIQDIDISVFLSDCELSMLHIHENNMFYDIVIVPVSELLPMSALLDHPYKAGTYADAKVLYDKTGCMEKYLTDFRAAYADSIHFKTRVEWFIGELDMQYHKVLCVADEIDVHCRFANYVWILCEAVLVANLKTSNWKRGLHIVSQTDTTIADIIIEAEVHRTLNCEQALALLSLYSVLWNGEYWDFIKREAEWLIYNVSIPIGFHSLYICFMMGLENAAERETLFSHWRNVTSEYTILPLVSIGMFGEFHIKMSKYLRNNASKKQNIC